MSVADWRYYRSRVLQAQGMVAMQADCTLEDALQMMKDRGEVSRHSLDEIAAAVLDGLIRFDE